MCEEYKGPLRKYKELGIEHLYLPTTDHFEPSEEDLMVSCFLYSAINAILFFPQILTTNDIHYPLPLERCLLHETTRGTRK